MSKNSKAYREAAEKVDRDNLYTPLEAARLAKETSSKKQDATVEVAIRLGVDPRKADQLVRGTVNLPHGTGKTARVAVFAVGDKAEEATAASAFSPTANTTTRAVLPVPCGRLTVPRTIWSALRGSTPSRIATSTVASCFFEDVSLASLTAWSGVYRLSRSTFSAASRYALLFLLIQISSSEVAVSGPKRALPRYCLGRAIRR